MSKVIEHKCKFCNRKFSQISSLSVHMCPKKKRWTEKDNLAPRLAFRVFQRFYELTTNAKNPKTIEAFIDSRYYIDFVKFGRYLVDLDPINADDFVTFVIQNGVKMKQWKSTYVYDIYLEELMNKEPVAKALERTIVTMDSWANDNDCNLNEFFFKVNTNEATFMIRNGRISPWVLYLSNGADKLFGRMNEEQGKIIQEVMNSSKWEAKFLIKPEDVTFVKELLVEAGI